MGLFIAEIKFNLLKKIIIIPIISTTIISRSNIDCCFHVCGTRLREKKSNGPKTTDFCYTKTRKVNKAFCWKKKKERKGSRTKSRNDKKAGHRTE